MFPTQKVKSLVGKFIQVEMKGEQNILVGKLESVDDYMNLLLSETSEYRDGEKIRTLGSVVLRGNNIILIQPFKE
jgi:small nuclear ribonucleoprotein (snRNP)-like protein